MSNWKYPVNEMPANEQAVYITVANHFTRAFPAVWYAELELFGNLSYTIGYPANVVIRWKERTV